MGGFLDYFTAVRVEFEARRKVTIECDKVLNMARGVIKLITEIDVFFFCLLIKFQHLIHVDGFESWNDKVKAVTHARGFGVRQCYKWLDDNFTCDSTLVREL